jgi:hypothetical protein
VTRPYRRPMIRCKCETCVADRRGNLVWLCFFIVVFGYIAFQIVRAIVQS